MEKIEISSNKSIRELVDSYPQVAQIMEEAGFTEITKPMMLQTAGRFMTLEKGAKMKNIEWDEIVRIFDKNGFKIKRED